LVKDVDGAFSTIISLVRDGKIRLNHGKVFPLSQFQLAIAEAESRGKMGKVLMI
jgi:NADPH:quinone reductase-like Zn-dependent oxidoreductase